MKPIWTEQATLGWKEVAAYILQDFGRQGLREFKQRTKENEKLSLNSLELVRWLGKTKKQVSSITNVKYTARALCYTLL